MKRISFKPEFKEPILTGVKTATARWRDLKLKPGEIVAAVTAQDGKPAFLVPAKDAFAHLEIEYAWPRQWATMGESDAKRTGVTLDWYLKEKPDAKPDDTIWFYTFKRIKEGV